MRARAMAVSVALVLLAGTTAGVASADQGGRVADGPAARVASAPAGLDTLLPADQLVPTGPAQWYMPWFQGGAGSNYLGQGGWRSYTPNYSPWGPYPTPQTAAFFGATSSPLDPWTTLQLTNLAALQAQLSGTNNTAQFQAVAQTGLAPFANANLATLQQLGLGTAGVNGTGSLTFGFSAPGSGFVLPAGQGLNAATLGQLVGAIPALQSGAINGVINGTGSLPFFGFGGFGGLGSFGGFPYGFGLTAIPGQ